METLNKSRWFVTSSTNRPGDPNPKLYCITTKDKVKINEAASKLMDIASGEYLAFVSNSEGEFALMKGTKEYTSTGDVLMGTDKATGKEIERYRGAKMACTTKKTGYAILLGSDANNWRPLRNAVKAEDDKIVVFNIAADAIEVDGTDLNLHEKVGTVKLYPISFDSFEDKIDREDAVEVEDAE